MKNETFKHMFEKKRMTKYVRVIAPETKSLTIFFPKLFYALKSSV